MPKRRTPTRTIVSNGPPRSLRAPANPPKTWTTKPRPPAGKRP